MIRRICLFQPIMHKMKQNKQTKIDRADKNFRAISSYSLKRRETEGPRLKLDFGVLFYYISFAFEAILSSALWGTDLEISREGYNGIICDDDWFFFSFAFRTF